MVKKITCIRKIETISKFKILFFLCIYLQANKTVEPVTVFHIRLYGLEIVY